MSDPEELQAQIDALRILVQTLLAHSPLESVRADAAIRFETWEDLHMHNPVSERYLDLMREEHKAALQTLDTLQEQRDERGRTA